MTGMWMTRGVVVGGVAAVIGAGVVGGWGQETARGEVREVVKQEGEGTAREGTAREEASREEALEKEVRALRQRVEAQRAYIEQLERELGRLKGRGRTPEAVPAPVPPSVPPAPEVPGPWLERVPRVPGPGEPLPRGWQEREFNGLKFYLVPVRRE